MTVMKDENPVNKAFGARLASERKKGGLTQADLARRVGIGRTTITNIERGRQSVSLPLLYRFAMAMGGRLDALLPPLVAPDSSLACEEEGVEYGENLPAQAKEWAGKIIRESEREPGDKK